MKTLSIFYFLLIVNYLTAQSLESHYIRLIHEKFTAAVEEEFDLMYLDNSSFVRCDSIIAIDEWGNETGKTKVICGYVGEYLERYYTVWLAPNDTAHNAWRWEDDPIEFNILLDLLKEDLFTNASHLYEDGGLYGFGAMNYENYTLATHAWYVPEDRYWQFYLGFYFK